MNIGSNNTFSNRCMMFTGNWYRAVVERRQSNKASLFFVDFGNSSLEDVTNLRCFSREFFTLPPQAIKCAFAGEMFVRPLVGSIVYLSVQQDLTRLRSSTHVHLGPPPLLVCLPVFLLLFSAEYRYALMCFSLCGPHKTTFCFSGCLSWLFPLHQFSVVHQCLWYEMSN